MARRNRGALTTAALVAAALIAGTVVSVCLALAAWRAEGEAHNAARQALAAKAEADDNARLAGERKEQVRLRNADLRRATLRDQHDAGSGRLGGRRSEPIRRVDVLAPGPGRGRRARL